MDDSLHVLSPYGSFNSYFIIERTENHYVWVDYRHKFIAYGEGERFLQVWKFNEELTVKDLSIILKELSNEK